MCVCVCVCQFSSANLIQDVTNEQPDLCHNVIRHKDVHVTWGQAVHLPCPLGGFIQEFSDLQQLLNAQHRHQQREQLQFSSSLGTFNAPSIDSGPELSSSSSTTSSSSSSSASNLHSVAPNNFISWHYHRRDNVLVPEYAVLQRRDKFVLAADGGLVILSANESGWYQCRLGSQVIHRYNLIIDSSKYLFAQLNYY